MLLLVAGALWIMASQRTPAEATAHARDELANCVAQGKCTPSPTPTLTRSPTPTLEPTSPPTSVALTSIPDSPTPTPAPSLPVPSDTPTLGYTRPSQINDGVSIELALPDGRWDIRTLTQDCAPSPWTSVWLRSDTSLSLAPDQPGCTVAAASWRSSVPCSVDDGGQCAVLMDASYWDWLGRNQATPTPGPIATDAPFEQPQVIYATLPPTPQPAPQVVYEIQVVHDLMPPTDTPVPEPTATPVLPTPTLEPVSPHVADPHTDATATPTRTPVPTTATPQPRVAPTPTLAPTVAPVESAPPTHASPARPPWPSPPFPWPAPNNPVLATQATIDSRNGRRIGGPVLVALDWQDNYRNFVARPIRGETTTTAVLAQRTDR